jgi:RNA polymerase sigma-70 factor (ECF subfamily)
VALNTAISWRRHQGRQVSTVPLEAFDLPDDDALREQAAHLRAMMARLPLADQRLLRLYLDGFSSAEIGKMLGLSQTNVTTRIGRAKEKLKKMNEI